MISAKDAIRMLHEENTRIVEYVAKGPGYSIQERNNIQSYLYSIIQNLGKIALLTELTPIGSEETGFTYPDREYNKLYRKLQGKKFGLNEEQARRVIGLVYYHQHPGIIKQFIENHEKLEREKKEPKP